MFQILTILCSALVGVLIVCLIGEKRTDEAKIAKLEKALQALQSYIDELLKKQETSC